MTECTGDSNNLQGSLKTDSNIDHNVNCLEQQRNECLKPGKRIREMEHSDKKHNEEIGNEHNRFSINSEANATVADISDIRTSNLEANVAVTFNIQQDDNMTHQDSDVNDYNLRQLTEQLISTTDSKDESKPNQFSAQSDINLSANTNLEKNNSYLQSSAEANCNIQQNSVDQERQNLEDNADSRYLRKRKARVKNITDEDEDDSEHDPFSDSGSSSYAPSEAGSIVYSTSDDESHDSFKNHFNVNDPDTIIDKQTEIVFNLQEETITEDLQDAVTAPPKKVTINPAKKSDGKRVRDKGHACLFCNQLIINNLARHYEKQHSNEIEVAKILALPKTSKQRRDGFINLARCGDFYHNCNVLATKTGEIILARRPKDSEAAFLTFRDFGPCPECLGFMTKKHIWHHLKYKCTVKSKNEVSTEEDNPRRTIAESTALLNGILTKNVTPLFTHNILNKFKNDDISTACKADPAILRYGAFLFEKYGVTQTELIRQCMRQIGRLVLELKGQDATFTSLSDVLIPQKFDDLVNATKVRNVIFHCVLVFFSYCYRQCMYCNFFSHYHSAVVLISVTLIMLRNSAAKFF